MTSARENSHGNGAGLPRVPSIPLSDDANAAADQSIGGLVKDATAHLSTLVRGEFELARSEIAKEVKKGLTGSVFFVVALVLLLLFIPFGLVALSLGFNDMWDFENHPWFGFLLVFGAAFLGAGALAWLGWRRFKKIQAPHRTIDSAKSTVAALRRNGDGEPDQLERRL
ncbi:phage holin family protein [Actinophytocola oryzae]|uniref:Putative superfamily III holin-X n=1 Tax=Actinophytocola oryzae TaxID=502181 RepID=A0A4R7UVB5_9PSEU|nr:phage holin family protein [Actinophytocola oryzae]TDV40649.1 putative superfamily III holin-X [Actinophytocola oryzae]